MKKGSPGLSLKNIISKVRSITKSKSLAIKSQVESMKARITICSLLKTKKQLLSFTLTTGSISHKIQALLLGSHQQHVQQEDNQINNDDENHNHDHGHDLQLVLYKPEDFSTSYYGYDYDDDKYPDLRHSLFDEDEEDDPNASVIDLVKASMERDGEDFSLENQIDDVADLFILKFHKRMRLQKLESFKRYQDMLHRSS